MGSCPLFKQLCLLLLGFPASEFFRDGKLLNFNSAIFTLSLIFVNQCSSLQVTFPKSHNPLAFLPMGLSSQYRHLTTHDKDYSPSQYRHPQFGRQDYPHGG